jgi:hypothetical protein
MKSIHSNIRGTGYLSRRDMLQQAGAGFGSLALTSLMQQVAGAARTPDGLQKGTHHTPTAKSVIFLFMEGGPSHIDLFDPKPELEKLAGKPLPESFGPIITPMGEYDAPLMPSKRKWSQHGESGLWVSDWLPHTAEHADDLAVIRSCWANGLNHSNGVCQMNTGSILGGRPSLGSWVNYGLGTANENLPAFVVIEDGDGHVINGPRNWSAGFMPASHQGIALNGGKTPIDFLKTPDKIGAERQAAKLRLLNDINRQHHAERPSDSELEARINSYELAFRMQAQAPEAVDLSQETERTQAMYGIDDKETASFGKNCLLARRLVERGVRFVQLYHTNWDHHGGPTENLEEHLPSISREIDQSGAALVMDLKQRGLLEDTIVIWGGEFGRTPMGEVRESTGRNHHIDAFTMWFAGGGFKPGTTFGETDEFGFGPIDHSVHVRDIHATLLHQLGLNHERLSVRSQGLDFRLTGVQPARVVKEVLA